MNAPVVVKPPAWWADMQKALGDVWASPPVIHQGRMMMGRDAYPPQVLAWIADADPGAGAGDPRAVTARDRLALYHQQMWQRWLGTLQEALPRVTAVVGPWRFNLLCLHTLAAQTPASADLSELAGMVIPSLLKTLTDVAAPAERPAHARLETVASLCARLRGRTGPHAHQEQAVAALGDLEVPWALLWQALNLDAAERHAYRARVPVPWVSPEDAAAWEGRRMRFTPSWSLLRVDFDGLVELRGESASLWADGPMKHPQHWVVFRSPDAVALQRVDAAAARLMALSREHTLAKAREAVMAATEPAQHAAVERALNHAVEQAMRLGWWEGVLPGESRAKG